MADSINAIGAVNRKSDTYGVSRSGTSFIETFGSLFTNNKGNKHIEVLLKNNNNVVPIAQHTAAGYNE